MLEAGPSESTSSRTAIIVFFATCGGAIGGALMAFTLILLQPAAILSAPQLLIALCGIGALMGFVPAAMTGVIYAFLPPSLQRIALAPFIGAAASGAYALWLSLTPVLPWYAAAGAGSAFVCAAVARRFRIDATGLKV
jgi:hypothetical protein